ncbi:MAG: ABC transporter ATP-binding protein [Spirochaetales bacterium]|nr:ABC transporter ATP-binding protein [Spirochaetales bacterium]
MNKLVVNNLKASYQSVQVLHDVSLTLHEGETVILLGTNGNGKSTVMKCIMGMLKSCSGEIYLERDGQRIDLLGKKTHDIVNMGITLVPEGRRLFPYLTVKENLVLGSYPHHARGDVDENLDYCYEIFPRLKERHRQISNTLSGGERQMLAIARSLMSKPEILLIDEASMGLAPVIVRDVMVQIGRLKDQRKLSILLTEQNFNQAIKIADRGYIIVHGSISYEGKNKDELMGNDLVKKIFLGIE